MRGSIDPSNFEPQMKGEKPSFLVSVYGSLGPKKQDLWPKINSSQMKLPNFQNPPADSSTKIGHDFINKDVQEWKLSKSSFSKKCTPKLGFFIEKKIRKV